MADQEIQKEAMKEAITEWMDKKFATFGKWSATGLLAMLIAGLTYIFLSSHGYRP